MGARNLGANPSPITHVFHDCFNCFVCGLVEKSANPFLFFIMNYDNILQAYKTTFAMPASEERLNLLDVLNYAEDCYVDHCEDVGYVAIQEIEEMEKETKDECVEILEDLLESCTIFEPKSILEQFKIKVYGSDR